MALEPGTLLGPYRILSILGAGGMGEVYLAEDTRLERKVAIKRLVGGADDPTLAGRVRHEARAVAALNHPNVATVFDVLEPPDGPFIVMEYVDGETLSMRLRSGPLDLQPALEVMRQLCDGIGAAHDAGIVHRDLKPSNIWLGRDGRVKILDFGIARRTPRTPSDADASEATRDAPTATLSRPGVAMGTPSYMAPEQVLGGHGDPRTDVHGLGCVLYEMLTGRRAYPVSGIDSGEALLARLASPPPVPSAVSPSIPASLDAVVGRALASDPAARFQRAQDLGDAIESVSRELTDSATRMASEAGSLPPPPSTAAALAPGASRRWRITPWAFAAFVAAAGAGLVFLVLRTPRDVQDGVAPGPPTVVAVLPFVAAQDDRRGALLGAYIAETLATRLGQSRRLHVLPQRDMPSIADGGSARAVAQELGAEYIVSGAAGQNAGGISVSADLRRRDAATPVWHADEKAGPEDLALLNQRLADGIRGALAAAGVAVDIVTSGARSSESTTANQEAYADYDQGRAFLARPDVPGNADRAIKLLESAVAKDPRFALAYAALGQARLGKWRETNAPQWIERAREAYLEALRLDPGRAEIRVSLAELQRASGQLDTAIEELRQAMRTQPQSDTPHRLLGGIFIDQNRPTEAIAELQEAIRLRPSYWRNHSELGYAYFRAGRIEEAIRSYERVTELQPDSALGYHMLGTVYQATGETASALANYEQANQLRPDADTLSNIGTLHYWRGEYAKAEQAYRQAIDMRPNDGGLLHNLGDVYRRLGSSAKATAAYEKAIAAFEGQLRINNMNGPVIAQLAMVQAKLGRSDQARQTIDRALAASPEDGDVLYGAAVVGALASDSTAACDAIRKALEAGFPATVAGHDDDLTRLRPPCEALGARR